MKSQMLLVLLGIIVLVSGCVGQGITGDVIADEELPEPATPVVQPQVQTQEPSPCEYTVFDECDGNWIEREIQHEDCSMEIKGKVEECEYGCSFGKCVTEKAYIIDGCISVKNFHFDAEAADELSLNDEYVTFANGCLYTVDITGWTFEDKDSNVFVKVV